MSFVKFSLLISTWLLPAALSAQQTLIKGGGLFAKMAYHERDSDALPLKGGGPYWILLYYAKGPVVKPFLIKAPDSHAKIIYVLPQELRGFEEPQRLSVVAESNLQVCNKF